MNKENGRFLEKELLAHSIDADASEPELLAVRNAMLALRRGLIWIVLAGFVFSLVGLGAAGQMEKKYTSVAQVMIDTRVTVDSEFAPVVSGLPTSTTTLESELEVLRSLDLIERLVDEFDLANDPEFASVGPAMSQLPVEEQTRILREMTIAAVADSRTIEQIGNISAVYAISFTTTDPLKSARLANALAQEYLKTMTTAKLRSLELSQGWLAERTGELMRNLTDLNIQLERHILAAPYSEEEVATIKVQSLIVDRSLRDRRQDLGRFNAVLGRVAVLRSIGKPQFAGREIPDPDLRLTEALAAYVAGDQVSTKRLETALDAVVAELSAQRDVIGADVAALQKELASMHTILTSHARHGAEMHRIENDIAVSEAIYRDFVAQLSRRTEQERYLDADARVIASARSALDPSKPQSRQMAAISAILAATLAALFILINEARQNRLRTVREFEDATGLPLVGVIPEAEANEVPPSPMLSGPHVFSPRMMRFARKLQASIPVRPASKKTKIIAGVAANPGEGLSTSMLMLATACAEAGESVLLIDLDFWNSPFWKDFPPIEEDADNPLDPLAKGRVVVRTDWDLLNLLPAVARTDTQGAPVTPDEFAASIEQLSEYFDWIFVDTAPLMQRMDVASLCRSADAVLLFARWNTTARNEVTSTLRLLSDVGVQPSAVVATRVDTSLIRAFGESALSFPARAPVADAG